MATCILAASKTGGKKPVTVDFKGKAKTKEYKELLKRYDIFVSFSDNAWMKENLRVKYLEDTFDDESDSDEEWLLIWDCYACHIELEALRGKLKELKIEDTVIPGGCTRAIQAPIVNPIYREESFSFFLATKANISKS